MKINLSSFPPAAVLIISFLLCLFFYTANSQHHFYDLKKDKPWVDSMKRIADRDLGTDPYSHGAKTLSKYFNACIALGEYYERLFHQKKVSSNAIAIHYYENVSDFGTFPYVESYFPLAALRNNVCRKLAAIFFKGDGVKKDKAYSLSLALKGSSGYGYEWLRSYYSQRYFHCVCILLPPTTPAGRAAVQLFLQHTENYEGDTAFSFSFNPFIPRTAVASIVREQLSKIAKNFMARYYQDNALIFYIVSYPAASMRSQAYCNKVIDGVKYFMLEKMKLPPDKIETNCEVGGGDPTTVDIIFKHGSSIR